MATVRFTKEKGACFRLMTTFQEILNNLTLQLSSMELMDFLDIFLVAFLFYKVSQLFRSATAWRIAKAIGVFVIATWVSNLLNMHALHFLLNSVFTAGLVALVVLFQPEIRRILDHVGSVSLSKMLKLEHTHQEMDTVINQTIMACERMSKERVGALIIFARGNSLEEQVKTGTEVDAKLTEQLLRNIFFPKAALHDGAVIVREGRVTAAGCVLPLSESKRLSADLGTRHRAGVGMSEASDAVVVIVSEETGGISVAVGGVLKKNLAPQTVERLLRNELMPNTEEKKDNFADKLKKKLRKDGKGDKQ